MDAFPSEIHQCIFAFVGPRTLCRLSCVSKNFRFLADDNEIWAISALGLYKSNAIEITKNAQSNLLSVTIEEGLLRDLYRRAKAELIRRANALCVSSGYEADGLTQRWMSKSGDLVCTRGEAVQTWMEWEHLRNKTGIDRFGSKVVLVHERVKMWEHDLAEIMKIMVE